MTARTSPLSSGPPRNLMARRRRPKLPALLGITALLAIPAALGADQDPDAFSGTRLTAAGLAGPDGQPLVIEGRPVERFAVPPLMAHVGQLQLLLPSLEVVLVGFHEASFQDAVGLGPIGTLIDNQNTTKFVDDQVGRGETDFHILASRGRYQGATTAVDVVLAPGINVLSPVTGTVTDVRKYQLYGRYEDTRIEIQPDDAPELRIVLIHVRGVDIRTGDRVVGGETILAEEANVFPFSSQVDRYTEPDRYGHVHIEVKPPGQPTTD